MINNESGLATQVRADGSKTSKGCQAESGLGQSTGQLLYLSLLFLSL